MKFGIGLKIGKSQHPIAPSTPLHPKKTKQKNKKQKKKPKQTFFFLNKNKTQTNKQKITQNITKSIEFMFWKGKKDDNL